MGMHNPEQNVSNPATKITEEQKQNLPPPMMAATEEDILEQLKSAAPT